MTVEEALTLIDRFLKPERLNKIQVTVFRRSWEGQSYAEIADNFSYDPGYVKDVGSKLWQLLSEALGEKVNKNNFQLVLKQRWLSLCESQSCPMVVGTRTNYCQDWGDATNAAVFFGRCAELAQLEQWIDSDRCQLVVLLGMGGIGKTALAVKLAQQIQDRFEYLIWRSLRNAPPLKELLAEMILFLCEQQEINLPETTDNQISRLMEYLRSHRCLLILDNAESILQSGERAGRYRQGYEGYGQLLRRIGEERHQSCLVLTSREKPIGISAREGETLTVRSHQLTGLPHGDVQNILKAKGLALQVSECQQLVNRYAGNPLALKIATTTIKSLFDGNISQFLEQGTVVFGDIWDLLDQQFNRLSTLEQQVMYWLAINREWMTLQELREDIVPTVSDRELLEALESLLMRSLIEKATPTLIEKQGVSFTQQPVVMEYVTERLISKFPAEITTQ